MYLLEGIYINDSHTTMSTNQVPSSLPVLVFSTKFSRIFAEANTGSS